MNIKESAKTARNGLQQGIYFVINPFVRMLIRMGVTPNMVTTIGLLGNVAAAAVFIHAGILVSDGNAPDYGLITLAGALIIAFSLFDMLDGQVARLGGMASTFGAMYDSVLDRYCEMFTLGGIAFFLIGCDNMECKIGFLQRPERVVITAVAAIATGIVGQNLQYGSTFDPNLILVVAMGFIAVFANITAFARITHSRNELIKAGRK